jgi:MFS family permease
MQGLLAPLRAVDLRRLLASNALWWFTLFQESVAFGWIVLELTDSPWQVALVGFFRSLPMLLFGFVAGPVTDHFGRRRVIIVAQAANLMVYLAIMLLVLSGALRLWQIEVASFVLGAAWAMDWPARRALMPDLVGKALTVDAMLLENFAQGWARMLGPIAAGALLAAQGPAGCFGLMAGLSAVALFLLLRLARQPVPRTTRRGAASPWTMLGQTLRYVGQSQPILGVMLITLVFNLWLIPYMTLLPVFARDVLGQGPVGLGLLGMASGIGAFAGLLLIHRLRRIVSSGWIFVAGTLGIAAALVLFSQSSSYGLSWALLLAAGIGQACFGIMQSSIILLVASDAMRSQTMGVLVLAIGSDPVGKLLTGALAESMGAPQAVGVQAGAAGGVIALIALLLPGLRAPVAEAPQPVPAATLQRDGQMGG